jgi:hypothetical protein
MVRETVVNTLTKLNPNDFFSHLANRKTKHFTLLFLNFTLFYALLYTLLKLILLYFWCRIWHPKIS